MRKSALAGLFAVGVLAIVTPPSRAHAQEHLQISPVNPLAKQSLELTMLDAPVNLLTKPAAAEQAVAPAPVKYVVADGDTLEKIAQAHATTWQRLFNKNTQIEFPDVLKAGSELTIPLADETLAERPLPQPPVPVATPSAGSPAVAAVGSLARGASTGNSYTPGYCTWYAKNRRPDLPNNLGNANTWVARAAAQGLATGSAPRAGAIGQQGMHVVYVESVNGDGTVTVSDMNYSGLYVITTRTVPASSFMYIY